MATIPAQPSLREFLRTQPYGLAGTMFFAQIALGSILFAIFQEYLPNELDTGDAFPGYVIAAYGGARFFGEPFTGWLSDRINRRDNLLVGLIVMAVAVAAMSTVQVIGPFIPLSALMGLGTGFLWPASYALAADLYSEAGRGKAVGVLNVSQLIGFGIGALSGAFLIDNAGSTPVFIIALSTIGAAWLVAFSSLGEAGRRRLRHGEQYQPSELGSVMNREVVGLLVVVLLFSLGASTVIPAIRPYGEDVLGVSFSRMTVGLIPAIAVGAVLYVPAGHASDRLGRLPPLFTGLALAPAGMLLMSAVDTFAAAMFAAGVIFAGYVISVPAFNSGMMDLAHYTRRGAVMGLTVAVTGLGLALGPAVGGAVAEAADPQTTFRVGAAFGAASVALMALLSLNGIVSPARLRAGRMRNLEADLQRDAAPDM